MRWAFVLWLLLGLTLAQSPSVDQLQRQAEENRRLQQQQQARIQALNRDLANLDAATQQQLTQLRTLQGEIARLEAERADLTRQIDLLEAQKKQAEARIAQLEQELKGLRERLSAMLLSLQREKAARYLPLLRAESFTDLAVRANWVSRLGAHQTDLVGRITRTVQTLSDERFRLQQLVDTLTRTKAERESRIQALGKNQVAVQNTVATLQSQRTGRAVLLRESLEAQSQLRRELSTIQVRISAEMRRIAEERRRRQAELARQREIARQQELARQREAQRIAQIRARQERERRERELAERQARERAAQQTAQRQAQAAVVALPEVPRVLNGPLLFPLQGGRISENYGASGNDWQTLEGPSAGSTVLAAASGYVSESLYYPNLGWIIVVQHSEGLLSTYINILDPRVSAGQQVSRGQVIGFTGGGVLVPANQLRFQVGVLDGNGNLQYVNPSRYY